MSKISVDGTSYTAKEFAAAKCLKVDYDLDLRGTGVTVLPDGLTVGGSLYLSGTGVTVLPDGLAVGGSLYLSGTGVTVLPDGLTVGGSLFLRGTGVTVLPDGLAVGGRLYLNGTDVQHIGKLTLAEWSAGPMTRMLTAGGRSIEEVAASWDCHTWENCPLHTAWGASGVDEVPAEWQSIARIFLSLFSAHLLPNPMAQVA